MLRVEESAPGEWPQGITEVLDSSNWPESSDGRRSLHVRIQLGRNAKTGKFEELWELLSAGGEPVPTHSAFPRDDWLWRHFPVFYLGVSRELDGIVLPTSRFWEEYLTALELPVGLQSAAERVLEGLHARLQRRDPSAENILHAIVQRNPLELARRDGPDIGLTPDDMFDELLGMDPILRAGPADHAYSFNQQGLATQSLAVMNLSSAFSKFLHEEMYAQKSRPLIIVEEPESHLSPQAARLLWRHVRALQGQKMVTTHSPYFVQHVPFRDLRLVCLPEDCTDVKSLPASFSASFPDLDGLEMEIRRSTDSLEYDRSTATLTVKGALPQKTYRRLLACCGSDEHRADLIGVLRDLRTRSSHYVADDELRSLEAFARRIRGEIFFAECWMIVEGPSDYLIVHALAHAMRYDLDWQGVSVIDAQNNGSPQAFAVLARALDIPWVAVFDGDDAGNQYIKQLGGRGFSETELQNRCCQHSAGDLEAQLVADGLGPELRKILGKLGVQNPSRLSDDALADKLRAYKSGYAAALADRFRVSRRTAHRGPEAFRTAISMLPQLKNSNQVRGNGAAGSEAPDSRFAAT